MLVEFDGDVCIVSPDAGRVKVAERFSQHLNADLAFVAKRRPRGAMNQVQALDVVGEVEGRICVLIDDMIDTAGTICAAADQLADHGAAEIYAMATHAVLSDPATDRLKNSSISKVVTSPDARAGRRRSRSLLSKANAKADADAGAALSDGVCARIRR